MSGVWNVSVGTVDDARRGDSPVQWMGPDLYRTWTGDENTDPYVNIFARRKGQVLCRRQERLRRADDLVGHVDPR